MIIMIMIIIIIIIIKIAYLANKYKVYISDAAT